MVVLPAPLVPVSPMIIPTHGNKAAWQICPPASERQPQAQLRLPHRTGGGDLAEGGRVRRAVAGTAQVRVIEDIERLCTELEAGLFGHRKLLEQAHVEVSEARVVNRVTDALLMMKRALRQSREDGRAVRIRRGEPILGVAGSVGGKFPLYSRRAVHHPVLAVLAASEVRIQADPGIVRSAGNTARQARLELSNPADLPATKHLSAETRLTLEEG